MERFVNPFTDYGFKRIFGQEISKDLLIDFLNVLLEGERHITDLQFMDKEQISDSIDSRGIIYDVYCSTDTGEKIIVEMQNRAQDRFKERALYYLSNAIIRQGERGTHWKYEIAAVYGVFLMNFQLEKETAVIRRDIILANRETHEQFTDKMRFIFIELSSFKKEEYECDNNYERWIYVLRNMNILKRMPFKAQQSVFTKLEEIADIASLTKEERMKYDESIKNYRDKLVVEDAMKREAREVGLKEGREEGRKEGRKEGREEGREEGLEEGCRKTKIEMAKVMKEKGFSIDSIVDVTSLDKKTIDNL